MLAWYRTHAFTYNTSGAPEVRKLIKRINKNRNLHPKTQIRNIKTQGSISYKALFLSFFQHRRGRLETLHCYLLCSKFLSRGNSKSYQPCAATLKTTYQAESLVKRGHKLNNVSRQSYNCSRVPLSDSSETNMPFHSVQKLLQR